MGLSRAKRLRPLGDSVGEAMARGRPTTVAMRTNFMVDGVFGDLKGEVE